MHSEKMEICFGLKEKCRWESIEVEIQSSRGRRVRREIWLDTPGGKGSASIGKNSTLRGEEGRRRFFSGKYKRSPEFFQEG